jgi:hypothetical protein
MCPSFHQLFKEALTSLRGTAGFRATQFQEHCTKRFSIKKLRSAHRGHLCVLYGSQNKRQFFPYKIN